MQQSSLTEDSPLTHVERPHFGTRVVYSLKPGGLLKEEFTSGVLTQSETIPYGAVWDAYKIRPVDRRLFAAAAAAALLLLPFSLLGSASAALAMLWFYFSAREVWTVFDYDGRWLVTCKGPPSASFRAFLEAFSAKAAQKRHPVQQTFESLDLEDFSWTSVLTRWDCICRYDRIILKKTGAFGKSRRYFYSLPALRPPIRLVWRHKIAAAAGGLAAWAAGTGALWFLGRPQGQAAFLRSGWWLIASPLVPAVLTGALILRLAVHFQVDDQSVLTPSLPWWQISKRRRLLAWLSRMVDLGQRIDDLDWDHYWDYHRRKLFLLKEEGLLDEWPYHSAMTRLNANEREELGD
ncbi:MAG: hypothetical protein P8Z49_11140 [Acidobacteriota bacterium]